MFRMTIKGMFARKLRLALSAVAVVLGVAFVTASFVLGDTISSSFDRHITSANEGVDTIVTARSSSGFVQEGVPVSAVDTVAAVDGVAAAEGAVSGYAELRSVETADAPALSTGIAIGWISDETLNPLRVLEGAAPTAADQVVVDPETAESLGVSIGDSARLVSLGPVRDVEVVGLAEMGEGGIGVLGIAPATAEEVFGYSGEFTEIRVRAEEGVGDVALRDRVSDALAAADGTAYDVRTGAEATEDNVAAIAEQTGMITRFLLAFAGITLFVGAFLIVNTFAMLTAQRTRELAVLRALGASRGQLLRGVLGESASIGAVAGVAGLGLGLLVAKGLTEALASLGLDLPEAPLAVEPRTVVVALLLGPVVTAFAALLPARRAASVQPVEAMREAALPVVSYRRRVVLGGLLAGVGTAAVLVGLSRGETVWAGSGAAATVLALTALGPLLIGPVTRVLSWPVRRFGGEASRLAEGNVLRSPRRSASTAAALMIGLALVSGTAVVGSSFQGMVDDEVGKVLRADMVVEASMAMPFMSPEVADAVADVPGVAGVAALKLASADVSSPDMSADQEDVWVTAMHPDQVTEVFDLPVADGSLEELAPGRMLVSEKSGLVAGDTAVVSMEGGEDLLLTVAGVYRSAALGDFLVSTEQLLAVTPHAADTQLFVTAADGVAVADLEERLDGYLLDTFPMLQAKTGTEFAESRQGMIAEAVNMISILLVLSLLVALLGVANTLTLSIIERTREVGMLRAIGMARRQLRSMVRVESLLMAAYGALVGVVAGVSLGWVLATVVLDGWDVAVDVPVGRLATFVGLTLLAAVGAAMLPARRAARMNVLDAVSTA